MPAGFVGALRAGRLLLDGPIGTELLRAGQRPPFEELNAAAPALVREVHRSYAQAGARALRANTLLARPGESSLDAARLARLGVELAREAAGEALWVGASVGAPRKSLPGRSRSAAPGYAPAVARQLEALAACGPDFLSLETFLHPEDLDAALEAARRVFPGPLIALFTLRSDLPPRLDAMSVQRVYTGLSRFLDVTDRHDVAAVGANCVPPGGLLELVRDFLARESPVPWGLLPAAPAPPGGLSGQAPQARENREREGWVVAACEAALAAGAAFVGGCCGVTPSGIRRLARMMRPREVRLVREAGPGRPHPPRVGGKPAVRREGRDRSLRSGRQRARGSGRTGDAPTRRPGSGRGRPRGRGPAKRQTSSGRSPAPVRRGGGGPARPRAPRGGAPARHDPSAGAAPPRHPPARGRPPHRRPRPGSKPRPRGARRGDEPEGDAPSEGRDQA